MINPYYAYISGFAISILTYQMGWSKIYPALSWVLIIFLVTTFIIHFSLGRLWAKKYFVFEPAKNLNPIYVTGFIFLLWIMEFIYGGIPVVEILKQSGFDYRLFGIPTLHVFIVTFSSFYSVFLFYLFQTRKKKLYLALFLVNVLPSLLIYNRGMLLFILTSSSFIYLYNGRFSFNISVIVIVGGVILLYLFGVMGNFRQVANLKRGYSSDLFLEIAQPTDWFKNSIVPNEFMWSYMYISSPLANLEVNIEHQPMDSLDKSGIQLITNEILPDFASKRINKILGWERINEYTIPGPFNVSTVYSRSYRYLGWSGIIIMTLLILAVPWLYWLIVPKSEYMVAGMAILSSMYLFLVFDNTIRFTGFSFQLVYPIVYPFIEKGIFKFKG